MQNYDMVSSIVVVIILHWHKLMAKVTTLSNDVTGH